MRTGDWTWLEVTKIAASVVTPLTLLALGWLVTRRLENRQWINQKLIERRITVFDSMAAGLNDLYCFFRCRGHFRKLDPPGMIARKRELDRVYHVNKPLFTPAFTDAYDAFIGSCFKTFGPQGTDARLKASAKSIKKERGDNAPSWDPSWDGLFHEQATSLPEIQAQYDRLLAAFATDLGVRGR